MAHEALDLIQDGPARDRALAELAALAGQLGEPGASERAAASVLGFLGRVE
jgi:hypothetical protein